MRVLEFSVMGQQIEKRGDFSGLVAGSEQKKSLETAAS